jgi:thioester reductase-like protein
MAYDLLTGATGLLGNYLLRDLLVAGRQVAVVVRPSRTETARQRVEGMLAFWEADLRRVLPRPPVLEGDICQPGLGLGTAAAEWVADHCGCVIHNAASLAFEPNEQTGEPRRSNIEGTRNVLELCRATGIRRFHHISTAYVCGLRSGRILEDELDVGQQLGNIYEETKVEAERLVRGAPMLDAPTIYRPAIIIGDSLTGYSTTFHGFYTPLKILQALADHTDTSQADGWLPILAAFNLSGHERKNYVPVDWVSKVITHIIDQPASHGRTYHVTPRQGAPLNVMCEAIQQALREQTRRPANTAKLMPGFEAIVQTLMQQLDSYRAYWRDDPEFDASHTREAAPHLLCPDVDREMLVRAARYALQANFGWPRAASRRPEFDVHQHLCGQLPVGFENGYDRGQAQLISVQVNGPGGGQWTVVVDGGQPVAAQFGLSEHRQALMSMNSRTFQRLVQGELSVEQAHEHGQLTLESSTDSSQGGVLNMLQSVASA